MKSDVNLLERKPESRRKSSVEAWNLTCIRDLTSQPYRSSIDLKMYLAIYEVSLLNGLMGESSHQRQVPGFSVTVVAHSTQIPHRRRRLRIPAFVSRSREKLTI